MTQAHSPHKITEAERIAKMIALRRGGATYRQIGEQMGCSEQNAYQCIKRQFQRMIEEQKDDLETIRAMELERLDALLLGQWGAASKGHIGAAQMVLRIMERRARMLGLDMPTKVASTNPEGTAPAPLLVAHAEMSAATKEELLAKLEGLRASLADSPVNGTPES